MWANTDFLFRGENMNAKETVLKLRIDTVLGDMSIEKPKETEDRVYYVARKR